MKETLSTIAERLGLSCTTVSRVLSGNPAKFRIPKETADKVIAEAERCNYISRKSIKSAPHGNSATIGLVLPGINNPFFADLLSIITSEINMMGYMTITIDTMENTSNEKKALKTLLSRQVEGIIIAPCAKNLSNLEYIDSSDVPVVLIDRYSEDTELSYVTTNNHIGGVMATKHLLSLGHKNIVCLQGVESSMPNKMRVSGYLEQMAEAGLSDFAKVVGREFSIQNGYIEAKMLLNQSDRPSAFFALSNTIALGILKAVKEAGMVMPDDISLISFDNNLFLDFLTPPLTRISQPVEDMAKLATKILFEKIQNRNANSSHILLTPNIIYGDSTKSLLL